MKFYTAQADDNNDIEHICDYTKQSMYDINDIMFYGAMMNNNDGTFNCFTDHFRAITNSFVSYDNLLETDIDYLLSSLCPHTLTPTISPTLDPTVNPTQSPTKPWNKILIDNKACIDASKREQLQFHFHLPFDGLVSGIILQHTNGSRKENPFSNTSSAYWGTSVFNQFSIFITDQNESPLFPKIGSTRNVINCNDKYDSDQLLQYHYCFDKHSITVNDSEFILYAPSYTVTTSDEWIVLYRSRIHCSFAI